MGFKKYVPSLTDTIKIILVVSVFGAIGVIAYTTGFVNKIVRRG